MDKRLLLPAILVTAFALRAAGIGYGLPHVYHQDEPMMVNHALAIGTGDWNTHYFVIPPFVSYFLFFIYGVFYLIGNAMGRFASPENFAVAFLTDPTPFYLLGRFFLSVLFGTATVAALYRLGKRHFGAETGLAAALFLALAPIHVQHSHYIYADVPVTLAVVLLFDALLLVVDTPSWKNSLLAGLWLGCGAAAKYTAVYFVPVIVLAHVLAHRRARDSALAGLPKLIGAGVLSLAVFTAIAPYTFLDWKNFVATMKLQSGGESYVGWAHHLLYSIGNGIGPVLLAMAAAGFFFGFRANARKTAVLAAGIIWFYLVNTFFSQHYARYILPLIPLLCLLAGFFPKKRLVLVIAAVSLAVPSLYLDALFLKTDTRTQCLRWFETNAADKAVVAVDNRFFAPPLPRDPRSFAGVRDTLEEEGLDRARRLRLGLLDRTAEGRKTHAVYVLVPGGGASGDPGFTLSGPFVEADPASLDRIGAEYLVFNFTDFSPAVHELRSALGGRWERVERFSPYWSAAWETPRDPHATTAAPHLWTELFSRVRLGPVIEIWRKRA